MMTDEQRFLFDLQGYLVIEGALAGDQVKRMNDVMIEKGIQDPENDPNLSRFAGFLGWGDDWRTLIDHPDTMPVVRELCGANFRLDHAYGMAAKAVKGSGAEYLHHHAGMFNHASFYVSHGNTMHNGLIVVSFALTDIAPGAGGFCCIPGSHKCLYPMPAEFGRTIESPLVKQIPQKAGDVVIFTEALTHGTKPWTDVKGERRSVLLKYCPAYMQWAQKPMNADLPDITDRQRTIMQGAHIGGRVGFETN